MPWRVKREVALILLGVVALVIAIIVLVINQSVSTDLLASLGLIGGAAMVIVSLPTNGEPKGGG
jgi:hypothetical protein